MVASLKTNLSATLKTLKRVLAPWSKMTLSHWAAIFNQIKALSANKCQNVQQMLNKYKLTHFKKSKQLKKITLSSLKLRHKKTERQPLGEITSKATTSKGTCISGLVLITIDAKPISSIAKVVTKVASLAVIDSHVIVDSNNDAA